MPSATDKKKNTPVTCDSPVTALAGIGPAKAAAYAKLGVNTVGDLVYHIPRAYENRGDIRQLDEARTDGSKTALVLTVGSVPTVARLRGRMSVLKFKAYDDSGVCDMVYFNQPFLKQTFVSGSTWRFYGTVEAKSMRGGRIKYSMSSPSYERYDELTVLPPFTAVYPLSEGLTQKQVASNIEDAIKICSESVPDILPDEIRTGNGLCTLDFALRNIHNPADYPSLARAKRRLVFDELFLFSAVLAGKTRKVREPGAFPCTKQNISPLLEKLPYELTGAQKRSVKEIAADMKTDIPMSRIVIGDVGSGKTVVAACAIYIAYLSGKQSALMAPTEILARQHYEDLSPMLSSLGMKCELLVGATTAAEKRRIKKSLSSDNPDERTDFVIGTHALLTDDTVFSDLALAVIDEQHRFGAGQRSTLASKTRNVHVLAMSATPIPRSLALVLYGDLDISKIDELPPGRQKIDTHLANESMRERVNAFIGKTVDDGGQVYIVCPSIDEKCDDGTNDGGEVALDEIAEDGIHSRPALKAAKVYAENLREVFPEYTIALIHGKMKAAEKEAIMTGFSAGDIDILVSTTVIEVGVNVPNATLMVVENSERFGLSQLHQLRGRVGRGKRKSYCVLISDDNSDSARTRLATMATTSNGFEIAEADLKARGPGDFLKGSDSEDIRQSGGLRFRFADLGGDASLFASASKAARSVLESDPKLDNHPVLKNEVEKITKSGNIA